MGFLRVSLDDVFELFFFSRGFPNVQTPTYLGGLFFFPGFPNVQTPTYLGGLKTQKQNIDLFYLRIVNNKIALTALLLMVKLLAGELREFPFIFSGG